MINLVIFDFDGTLVDTKIPTYVAIKSCLEKMKICLVDSKLKKDLGNWPLIEHLKKLGVEKKDLEEVSGEIKLAFIININKIRAAPYLSSLEKIDKKKIVLTNNEPDFIKVVLRTLGVNFFSELYGPEGKEDKAERLKEIMKKHGVRPKETAYLGDKPFDMIAARKAGCYSIAVASKIAWGSTRDLINAEPDFIISSLKEVESVLANIDSS